MKLTATLFLLLPFALFGQGNIDIDFSNQENLNSQIKESLLVAIEKYPELKNNRIRVINGGNSKIAHQAIFKPFSIFRKKSKRVYLIKIASQHKNDLDATLFFNLNSCSRIGVLGHELSHILDYTDDNIFDLIKKGMKYSFSKSYKIKYEREINLIAMKRSLAKEILCWSEEVHSYLKMDGRGEFYHNPKEIKKFLDEINNNYP